MRLWLIYILLVFCNTSYAQYDFLLHKSFAERTLLLDSLLEHEKADSDRLEKNIRLLYDKAIAENDQGLVLELSVNAYRILNKDYADNNDKAVAYLKGVLKDLNKKKYPEYELLLKYRIGRILFKKNKDYLPAFRYYIDVYEGLRNYSYKDFPAKKVMLTLIGNAYYGLEAYDNAIKLYREATTIPAAMGNARHFLYQPINGIGMCYRNSGVYDSAIYYFEKLKELAIANNSTEWEGISAGNTGATFYMQNKYDIALPLLYHDLAISLKKHTYNKSSLKALIAIADIHVRQDSLAMAEEEINIITSNKNRYHDKLKFGSEYYPLLTNYYYKKGNYKNAYLYRDSAAIYTDSLTRRDNILKLEKAKFRSEIEQYDVEMTQLVARKQMTERERDGLLVGIILLFVIVVLVVNRHKLKNRIKQNELDNYTKRLQEKSSLIEKLERNLSATKQNEENNELIQQLYTSTILTDEEWEQFRQMFEHVHKGFIQRLKEQLPDITPADMRFLVLTKLKMSNKEMAGILGVQPDSIRTYKYRLRKKINLGEHDSIKRYVDNI